VQLVEYWTYNQEIESLTSSHSNLWQVIQICASAIRQYNMVQA